MIQINWKKGELLLSETTDTLLMEASLIISSLYKLLLKEGYKESDIEIILKMQTEVGIDMARDDNTDYISVEKYIKHCEERGER